MSGYEVANFSHKEQVSIFFKQTTVVSITFFTCFKVTLKIHNSHPSKTGCLPDIYQFRRTLQSLFINNQFYFNTGFSERTYYCDLMNDIKLIELMVLNITAGQKLTLREFKQIATQIRPQNSNWNMLFLGRSDNLRRKLRK